LGFLLVIKQHRQIIQRWLVLIGNANVLSSIGPNNIMVLI
jgi:hypothetical protein